MILQPDEPDRRDDTGGGPAADAPTGWSTEVGEEPVWVVPSIVLALVALSGSVLLFAVAVIVGVVLWALSTPPLRPPGEGRDPYGNPMGRPFGGPGLMP